MVESVNAARSIIGVTGPDHGGLAAWWFTKLAVWRAGGRARRITPKRPCHVRELDGLILGGGADVAPDLYGAESLPQPEEITRGEVGLFRRGLALLAFPLMFLIRRLLTTRNPGLNIDRDKLEQNVLRGALDRNLPILGICRGAQLLNVTMGGTLHQHLTGFYQESPNIRSLLPRKQIMVEPDSCLARILGCATCGVNALHDQAVDRLGEAVRIVAREPNGVVQAVELTTKPFVVGVQWHPEYLPHHRRQQRLFQSLVDAARQPRP
ncbi:gamma-glutamyl-gamma-aminobutyrate hydrolase family protein [Desulfonatronum thioautotrophicum]|uniref:gamma-glutamyl-gamma-aminobutyrate hydrolase family protein n=1 Tax=Desulfonatronum thioautotrophicum TaxID=617001 RepID=UPI0005EBA184|nr:gamma-glutamyl-gamma-aminobutyrate hydrolase family protein [Desulfonatronum thioautotrophicum]